MQKENIREIRKQYLCDDKVKKLHKIYRKINNLYIGYKI